MDKKIKSLSEIKSIVTALKKEGKTIVFANGCFDLLHVGHVRYLRAAKNLGDILIVGINSDVSVQKIKGEGRPLIKEGERAEIISELEAVDYVLIFFENNVERILRELTPDFHAKGTDYTVETVPEREVVLSYGGRIAIVGDPKDRSTTEYIKSLNNN